MFNPWPTHLPNRGNTQKRTARLVGTEPGTCSCFVTFHDWQGRALRVYHIRQRKLIPFARPSPQQWDQYKSAPTGVDVPPPKGIQANDVEAMCQYAEEQANNLGLTITD